MGRSKRNKIKGYRYEHPPEEIEMKPSHTKIFLDTVEGLKLVTNSPVPSLDYERVREIIRPKVTAFNSQLN